MVDRIGGSIDAIDAGQLFAGPLSAALVHKNPRGVALAPSATWTQLQEIDPLL